tara:strand:+ start:848 stop:1042 length:195 start_codon:yes stop_codon:yes gene_type:complete
MEYKTAWHYNLNKLDMEVNMKLEEGYELYGNQYFMKYKGEETELDGLIESNKLNIVYVQPMIKR